MKTFGIISEGPTDQIILENILVGYFNNDDLSTAIRPLQPLRDATDATATQIFGGWYKVFEYCKSNNFIEAFEQNDYIIIQIDTDRCEEEHYDVKKTDADGNPLSVEELIEKIIQRFESIFIEAFGQDYFALIQSRIIYAVSVNEIECWLLPLYYDDKIKSSINSCIYKLNPKLKQLFDFYIDPGNKSNMGSNYDKMSRKYSKNKELVKAFPKNPSFAIFIKKLAEKNITIA